MVFLYANESCEKAVLHQTLKMTKKGCDKSCVTPFFVFTYFGSIIYGTDESELILQPHFYFRY
ncbi:hypothetical protein EFP6CTSP_16215 [Enterococcus faecium]|nr:hypothetical protein EFP6CTSP_16215 [Enterococcus faecium]